MEGPAVRAVASHSAAAGQRSAGVRHEGARSRQALCQNTGYHANVGTWSSTAQLEAANVGQSCWRLCRRCRTSTSLSSWHVRDLAFFLSLSLISLSGFFSLSLFDLVALPKTKNKKQKQKTKKQKTKRQKTEKQKKKKTKKIKRKKKKRKRKFSGFCWIFFALFLVFQKKNRVLNWMC